MSLSACEVACRYCAPDVAMQVAIDAIQTAASKTSASHSDVREHAHVMHILAAVQLNARIASKDTFVTRIRSDRGACTVVQNFVCQFGMVTATRSFAHAAALLADWTREQLMSPILVDVLRLMSQPYTDNTDTDIDLRASTAAWLSFLANSEAGEAIRMLSADALRDILDTTDFTTGVYRFKAATILDSLLDSLLIHDDDDDGDAPNASWAKLCRAACRQPLTPSRHMFVNVMCAILANRIELNVWPTSQTAESVLETALPLLMACNKRSCIRPLLCSGGWGIRLYLRAKHRVEFVRMANRLGDPTRLLHIAPSGSIADPPFGERPVMEALPESLFDLAREYIADVGQIMCRERNRSITPYAYLQLAKNFARHPQLWDTLVDTLKLDDPAWRDLAALESMAFTSIVDLPLRQPFVVASNHT
jgi:hypothetical protein